MKEYRIEIGENLSFLLLMVAIIVGLVLIFR